MLNAWLDHHERSHRCAVLATMTHFEFRKLHPTEVTRVRDDGIWELCLVESTGRERLARFLVDTMRKQLLRPTKRKRNKLRFSNVPFVFRDVGTHQQREQAQKFFWERWDELGDESKGLLKAKRIKWSA